MIKNYIKAVGMTDNLNIPEAKKTQLKILLLEKYLLDYARLGIK